ncbi:MAG: beta-fructofuranosidase [Frankiales bacterium]|nr:beta-fructofuranosidase [Frankiales bacterium]
MDERVRPSFHFTVRAGWTNDPYGLVHHGGRYHLFFQYVPDALAWAPNCHWGHASSDDLIAWTEEEVALTPRSGEVGCWSGSVVLDGDVPTMLYTRIATSDWGQGQVALARGDDSLATWRREPEPPVIAGPPPELAGTAFRDPFVWREPDGWKLVIGIGLPGGTGAALQYTSDDLLQWSYSGVLAQKNTADTEGAWTGQLWECPQLFALDGSWVLLVSVWEGDVLHYVAYAVGDYDGRVFNPRRWGRFSQGGQLYASSAFLDAEGRRCVMSWFREAVPVQADRSPYASAVSLPHTLHRDGDRVWAEPHPNLSARWRESRTWDAPDPAGGPVMTDRLPFAAQLVLTYRLPSGGRITLTRSGPDGAVSLVIDLDVAPAGGTVRGRDGEGRELFSTELHHPAGVLTAVLDADLLELSGAGIDGIAAVRIPARDGARLLLEVIGDGATAALQALT